MSNLITYTYHKMPIRVVVKDGRKIYFVIRDICNIIGLNNPNKELVKHTNNVPMYERIQTPGGLQVVRLVPIEDMMAVLDANGSKNAVEVKKYLKNAIFPRLELIVYHPDLALSLLLYDLIEQICDSMIVPCSDKEKPKND